MGFVWRCLFLCFLCPLTAALGADSAANGGAKISAPSYSHLSINDEEAKTIWHIVDTIADHNPIMLGLKRGDLEKQGEKLSRVHPLRFLGTIFTDPHLKVCMRDIRGSIFKWMGFMGGLEDQLEVELERGNLIPYLPGFCKAVGANPDQVEALVRKKDWRGFVDYLIKLD